MTKKLLIGLNTLAILATIYWMNVETDLSTNPEPIITFILALINLIGLGSQNIIDKRFGTKQSIIFDKNQGTVSGAVQNQTNNYSATAQSKVTQSLAPLETSGDGVPLSNESITGTPKSNDIDFTVNGQWITIGDGNKSEPCYFSSDGGITSKKIDQVTIGDKLYWNESVAGYKIDQTDKLIIKYLA